MKKKNTFGMLAVSFLMLFSSCSREMEFGREENPDSNYGVRFTLGGSVMTRAAEVQSADEKKVSSLYAVVFKDATNAAKTGTNNQEIGSETFYKCIDVLAGTSPLAEKAYVFELGEPGAYQICFVANPGTQLKGKVDALKGKTVAEFKKLTEENQGPETKPMLMTSGFYGATVSSAADADLQTVLLTRAMARIDIVNQAPGVTVTKAVLKNRATKTVLITDKVPAFQSTFVEATQVYDNLNLKGTATGADYKEKIYSYEQYGTDANAPSMDITYTIDGRSYTHHVEFKTQVKAGGQQINLKRNTLYKVKLSNRAGQLKLELSVADWESGETFAVSSEDIKGGILSGLAVGDFMLKDGSLIKSTDPDFAAKKKDAIGVVFYVGQDRVGQAAKTKLKNNVHGLVMALKNAGQGIAWKNANTTSGLPFKDKLKLAYEDFDGYGNTQKIYTAGSSNLATQYPAFHAVKTYAEKTPAPANTTGWYLPAIGEWYDILENLGGVKMNDQFKTDNGSIGFNTNWTGTMVNGITATSNINQHLQKIGGAGVENFDVDSSNARWFWSSSEFSVESAVSMNFNSTGALYLSLNFKTNANTNFRVRCVLAF